MKRAIVALILTVITSTTAYAGQVTLSCDFKGTDGVDDVEVKRQGENLVVNLHMVDQKLEYYSLPVDGKTTPQIIDLSAFHVFNDIPHPTLKNIFGNWYYLVDARSPQLISCVWLH